MRVFMKNNKVLHISINAMILAILAIMTFVPYVGYIPFFGISITLIHIVVLISALFFGTLQGTIAGLMWGVLCLIKAIANPTSPTDPIFINPLLSILPRVLFGFISGVIFSLIRKNKNDVSVLTLSLIACGLLTILHTVMVMFMYYLEIDYLKWCYNFASAQYQSTTFFALMELVFVTNCIPECALAMIVTPLLFIALKKAFPHLYIGYRKEEKNYAKTV